MPHFIERRPLIKAKGFQRCPDFRREMTTTASCASGGLLPGANLRHHQKNGRRSGNAHRPVFGLAGRTAVDGLAIAKSNPEAFSTLDTVE
jgi:hypothetical protein